MRMSERLEELGRDAEVRGPVTIQSLVDRLGTEGHAVAILILSVPFVQPIPMLGLSTVFGAAIITIGLTYAVGKQPYVPQRFRDREVPAHLLALIGTKGARVFRWIERFVKPRGRLFHAHPAMRAWAAALIVVSGVLLALPLPIPASNTIPTIPIILLALGLLEGDGHFIAAGYVAFAMASVLFAAVFLGPLVGVALTLGAS